jgi:acyl-CoA thioesterase FadM
MKSLPYKSELITVSEEMCDHNGHMNVNFYYKLFDKCYTDMYVEDLDFTSEYLESGFSTFTLEDSIRYLKEFRLGDKVYPSFYLNNANKKLLHFVGILLNDKNDVAAIFETVLGHINLNERKMTNFSDDKLLHILNYFKANKLQKDLPFELKLKINDLQA